MRTGGQFNIQAIKVKCRQNDYVTLVPFGDVHFDSPAHADAEWQAFKDAVQTYHNPVFLGMGDYMDGYSTSERRIIYSKDLHESTTTREEVEARKRVEKFAKEIEFMRGKLLGIMGGNHYQQYGDGTTSDQYLARLLGADYLGACAAIRMTLSNGHKEAALDIFAHHGRGGGTTAGGRMNAVEKLEKVCDADIYLMGDNHARGALPLGDRLRLDSFGPNGLHLTCRKQWIGRTGSFLKSYEPGKSSYVTDAAMPPASLGWISFRLKLVRDRSGGGDKLWVDIRAEQ